MNTAAITWFATVPSPVGPLVLTKRGDALVGLSMHASPHASGRDSSSSGYREDPSRLAREASQLAEYFAGTRTRFEFAIELEGTPFQRRVWEALRQIPPGETQTYAQVAARLGQPRGARAVAAACAANPLAMLVPCHRVVRKDGDLGGYRWGLERKRALLARERTAAAGDAAA